jgi:hypothetical protein
VLFTSGRAGAEALFLYDSETSKVTQIPTAPKALSLGANKQRRQVGRLSLGNGPAWP